ncbi:carbonic anhydrase-related protein-like [Belonocnema kinseyi]|uniref:carbonic anhydrase-related protein-like n=1 Tax=Belonocnema kinseyi TaxID=2817044 RepID=UPI00143D2625|nr:carbonic anhydrase-related protein-like [Belonocnema kinseyi]
MKQLCLTATILLGLIVGTNTFSYKEAKNWGKQYPECNGKHQSPVIYTPIGQEGFPNISKILRLTDFQKLPKKLTMKNNGHTVEMKADWNGKPPSCTGGPLHGNYVFEKATFHWAPKKWAEEVDATAQEEDSFLYDIYMEMHLFFYRTDLKSFEKAQKQKGGLAVFKMAFQSRFLNPEHLFDNLEKKLHKVQSPNSTTEITPFRLLSHFDDLYTPFIFYEGSLDYPPCLESVTWFIYETGTAIKESLVKEFRKIKLANGDVSNVRPTQPLNKRQVKIVFTHNRIAMEMHVFFYRTDFKSFKKAETQKGGLAVFKMKFQTGFLKPTDWLDDLSKTLHKVKSPNSTAEIKPFPLLNDFDNAYTSFLFYEGSLDYPPCSESVTWFTVEVPVQIIDSVVKEFKKIKLAEGDVSNVRPMQPLNKRQIKYVANNNNIRRIKMNQLHLIATVLLGLILGANAFSYKDAENWGKNIPSVMDYINLQ